MRGGFGFGLGGGLGFRFGVGFCLGFGFRFFGGEAAIDFIRFGRMNLVIILVGFRQLLFVYEQAVEAIVGAQFEIGVHFDGVERADFDANLAAHAYRKVDVENRGIQLRFADVIGLLVLALLDVDAFGRTFLFANLAGDAAQAFLPIIAVENEEGKLPHGLGQGLALFGILNGRQPFLGNIAPEKILGGDRHAFDDAFA